MNRSYTLKSGEIVHAWVNSFNRVAIYPEKNSDKEVCTILADMSTGEPIIEYKGEKINVNNFNYMPLNELLKKVDDAIEKGDRWAVDQDDALATIMKESEKVGFVMEVKCFETVVPGLGFGLKSDRNRVKALLVPFEDIWKKNDWGYKIELMAEDESIRRFVGKETMYFSDIWSGVMQGNWIKLVDREEYKKKHPEYEVVSGGKVTVLR